MRKFDAVRVTFPEPGYVKISGLEGDDSYSITVEREAFIDALASTDGSDEGTKLLDDIHSRIDD